MHREDNAGHEDIEFSPTSGVRADIGPFDEIQRALPGLAPLHASRIEGIDDDAARAQKITRISRALADGSYCVNSSDVAKKLIDHMLGRLVLPP